MGEVGTGFGESPTEGQLFAASPSLTQRTLASSVGVGGVIEVGTSQVGPFCQFDPPNQWTLASPATPSAA